MKFMHKFWEFLAYFANAAIFLIVGISVKFSVLISHRYHIGSVIIAVLIARLIVIYGLIPLINKIPKQPKIKIPYRTVIYWGGLRGAIDLAIVLSLDKFEHTELFISVVLGVVLFTLIVQGLTIEKLVAFLN